MPQQTVADVLDGSADAAVVFLRHRMACPGCVMAPFKTIAEAAATYRLDPEDFAAELEGAISPTGKL